MWVATLRRIPPVVARRPRHIFRERGEQVEERQSDDHVVVDADEGVHHDVANADTCNRRKSLSLSV